MPGESFMTVLPVLTRVLHVVNVYNEGEAATAQPFVKSQIQSLRNQGLQVDVFNIRGNESRWNYIKAFVTIRRFINRKQYDIIHGHYVYSGLIAASQRRVPSVVSFMGSDLNGSPKANGKMQTKGYVDIFLSHLLEFMIDGIVVKTRRMRERLLRPQKSILVPNGVDFGTFFPMPQKKARRQIGIEEDSRMKYILFAGGPSSPANKGFELAERTIRELESQNCRVELLTASGVSHQRMPYYMNAADALLLASLKEGSPNVIKEALACNLPVVSTDVGDVSEVIKGVDCCTIVARDPIEAAKAIKDIFEKDRRTNGRHMIKHLQIEKIAQRLICYYCDLRGQRRFSSP